VSDVSEAGRVLSQRNATALVRAWRQLGSILTAALGSTPSADDDEETAEEALSHRDIRAALDTAIRDTLQMGDGYWMWIEDEYDDAVIYRYETPSGAHTYQRSYTITDAGVVTLGDPVEVMARTEYVPVEQATAAAESLRSDPVPLTESAIADAGAVQLKVIQPGWGSSGYYSAEMLERDGPNIFTSGTHMYIDHPSATESEDRPERSVRDIAGVLTSDARWEADGPAGPGLYAEAAVFGAYRDLLDDLAPHIGVSIRASGTVTEGEADGRRGRLIDSLVSAESVDWVTKAGAGGQVVTMLESARSGQPRRTSRQRVATTESGAPVVALVESTEVSEMDAETQARIDQLEAENARLRTERATSEARTHIAAQLANAELPAFAVRRITEALVAAVPMTEAGVLDTAALDIAIVAARDAWRTDLAESGTVRGMGPSGGGSGDTTQLEASLTRLFAHTGLSEAGVKAAVQGRR